jgi:hypothetical protein
MWKWKLLALALFYAVALVFAYPDEQDFVNHRGNYSPEMEAKKVELRQLWALQQAMDDLPVPSCK